MKRIIDIFSKKKVKEQRIRVSQAPKEAVYLAHKNGNVCSEVPDIQRAVDNPKTPWITKDSEFVICVEKNLIESRTVSGDALSIRLAMNLESRDIPCWETEIVQGEERVIPWIQGRLAIKASHIWPNYPQWARRPKIVLVDKMESFVGKNNAIYRKGSYITELTFASGSPSMARAGNFYALNPKIWPISTYCSAIGFDLDNYKLRFDTADFGNDAVKALSRQYLSGSSGHLNLAFGKDMLNLNGGLLANKKEITLACGGNATHFEMTNGFVFGYYPDGEVVLAQENVLVNQTRTYTELQTRTEKILEDGLVSYVLKNHKNNYTDGQGFIDAKVWKKLFPSAKGSVVTGRAGTNVKGVFIKIPGLKARFGTDVMFLDGQVKSPKALEKEIDNGWIFCTTRILNAPEWLSESNISNISLQYLHEDWNNTEVREALINDTYETYKRLIELEPQALMDRFGREIETDNKEDMSTEYDELLGRIIRELNGNVKGFSIYESRIKALIRSMTKKVSNLEHFMVDGVMDYIFLGDPLLYLNSLDKLNKCCLTEAEAKSMNAIGRDEIVTAVRDDKGPKFLEGKVSLLRTPCSSRLSVRQVDAVKHKGYAQAFGKGLFIGCQIRSAVDLNSSCQDGADYDGDRCKIITKKEHQFLSENNPYKIDGWIKNGQFFDKCPY